MAVEVEKKVLSLNQIVADKNETASIEGDAIVPDVKPDIMNIIGTSGIVSVYKTEVSDGKVRIDGCVNVYVMYYGNDGENNQVRSINPMLDFSQIISIPEAKSNMNNLGEVTLENIECKIVNERKINVKANLNFGVKLSSTTNVEYVSNIDISDLQKIDDKVCVNTLIGTGETKTSISEKIAIDSTDNLAEILKVDTSIVNVDTKVSYNKVLIKADIILKMLYSTEDGRINMAKATYPIMGFIDISDVGEDSIINSSVEIKNFIIKQDGSQDKTVSVDIEVGMKISVQTNQEISIVKDMYSPSINLEFTQEKINATKNTHIYKSSMNYASKELLDIGDEKVYDIEPKLNIQDINMLDGAVDVSGNVVFNFLHSSNKMTGLELKTIESPFEYRIPCDGIKRGDVVKVKYEIANENFNILPGGEVDLRMDLVFIINSSNITKIEIINSVEEAEENTKNAINMVVYYTKPQDTLWQIAKEFRSTIPDIMKQNNLESESIEPGTQLFICHG